MPIVIFFFSPAFQSTPSAWRETNVLPNPMPNHGISIHSLRMEGDFVTNPFSLTENVFQSTPSAWRETR